MSNTTNATEATRTPPEAPAVGAPVQRGVRPLDVFCAADDALTYHERPFYRACAGGAHFERTPEWEQKRRELTHAWYVAHAAALANWHAALMGGK